MSTIVINGTLTIDISGLEELVGEIRSTTINALQGEIRSVADQILRELVERDWPAGRATQYYVSTGELVDAINVSVSGTSLNIEMDGSRMGMTPPSNGMFGAHMGLSMEPKNIEMPRWLNEGGNGSRLHEITGTHYFDNAFDEYVEIIPELLAKALRAAGFEVSSA